MDKKIYILNFVSLHKKMLKNKKVVDETMFMS